MILKHVAQHTGFLIISRTGADSQLFGGNNADISNMMPVPERFKNGVGKPEDKRVLNGFFSKVMINAENLIFPEVLVQNRIQFKGCFKITAERFLNNNPGPAAALLFFFRQAGPAKQFCNNRIQDRRV